VEQQLRLKIIGDPRGAITSLNQVNATAMGVATGVRTAFTEVGSIIKSSLGFVAGFAAVKQALDLASQGEGLQRAQTALIQNQIKAGGKQATMAKDLAGTWGTIAGTSDKYSTSLVQQANMLSIHTGISVNAITQAQNLLIPNSDLLNLYQQQKGSFGDITQAAANLSSLMGGNIVTSARMLGRVLADPAKRMGQLSRYGFSLNAQQTAQIKNTTSLLKQQELFVKDVNQSMGGVAQAAISPMQRIANDFKLILQQLGVGLLPILDAFATFLEKSNLISAITPLFTTMAAAISQVSQTIGVTFGQAVQAATPLLKIFTAGIMPNLMNILQPALVAVGQVLQMLSKTFTSTEVKPFIASLDKVASLVVAGIKPAFAALVDLFKSLTSSQGAITMLFKSLADDLTIIAPVLPNIVLLMAQLLQAVAPFLGTMVPSIAVLLNIAARAARVIGDAVGMLAKAFSHMHWLASGIGGILGVVAAVWFTRNVFLRPILGIIAQVRSLTATLLKLGSTTRGLFAGFGKGAPADAGIAPGIANRYVGALYGKAQASQALMIRELGRQVESGEVSYRSYNRQLRELNLAGPVSQVGYSVLKRANIPGIGSALSGGGEKGFFNKMAAYLLGPSKNEVMSVYKMSEALIAEEEEQKTELEKNTAAMMDLTTAISDAASKSALGGLTGSLSATTLPPPPTPSEEWLRTLPAPPKPPEELLALQEHLKTLPPPPAPPAEWIAAQETAAKKGAFSAFRDRVGGGLLGRVGSRVGGMMRGLPGKVAGGAGAGLMVAQMSGLIPQPGKGVGGAIGSVAQGAMTGMMFGPWGAAAGALLGLGMNLYKNWKPFHNLVNAIGKGLKTAGEWVWKHLQPAFKAMWPVLKEIGTIIKDVFVFEWKAFVLEVKIVVALVKDLWSAFMDVWHAIDGFWHLMDKAWHAISYGFNMAWYIIYGGFVKMANMIIRAYDDTLGAVIGGIAGALGFSSNTGNIGTLKEPAPPTAKFHSGGMVPGPIGRDFPATLQGGEAVLSIAHLNAMKRGGTGGGMTVAPGAVVITVQGSADPAVAAQIQRGVERAFHEFLNKATIHR